MTINLTLQVLLALVCAGLISLGMTPIIRVLAYKIGAVAVAKDKGQQQPQQGKAQSGKAS